MKFQKSPDLVTLVVMYTSENTHLLCKGKYHFRLFVQQIRKNDFELG